MRNKAFVSLFPGGCGRFMTNFHLLFEKELKGKQIHQNEQKHHIRGGRTKN